MTDVNNLFALIDNKIDCMIEEVVTEIVNGSPVPINPTATFMILEGRLKQTVREFVQEQATGGKT